MATTKALPFLMWYDDNPKRTIDQKVKDACEAFTARFRGAIPTLILLSADEPNTPPASTMQVGHVSVNVQIKMTVRKNTVWVGREESDEQ